MDSSSGRHRSPARRETEGQAVNSQVTWSKLFQLSIMWWPQNLY